MNVSAPRVVHGFSILCFSDTFVILLLFDYYFDLIDIKGEEKRTDIDRRRKLKDNLNIEIYDCDVNRTRLSVRLCKSRLKYIYLAVIYFPIESVAIEIETAKRMTTYLCTEMWWIGVFFFVWFRWTTLNVWACVKMLHVYIHVHLFCKPNICTLFGRSRGKKKKKKLFWTDDYLIFSMSRMGNYHENCMSVNVFALASSQFHIMQRIQINCAKFSHNTLYSIKCIMSMCTWRDIYCRSMWCVLACIRMYAEWVLIWWAMCGCIWVSNR